MIYFLKCKLWRMQGWSYTHPSLTISNFHALSIGRASGGPGRTHMSRLCPCPPAGHTKDTAWVSWWKKTLAALGVHAQLLSRVQLFATQWTIALQAPLSMGILQARILEWVSMPSSRGSSLPWIELTSLWLLHWHVGSLPLAAQLLLWAHPSFYKQEH